MRKRKPKEELDPTAVTLRNLREGLESPFWTSLKAIIQEEREAAETAIFEDDQLDDKQRDQLRLRRNVLVYVMDLPKLVIEHAILPRPSETPDFETYAD